MQLQLAGLDTAFSYTLCAAPYVYALQQVFFGNAKHFIHYI